MSIALPDLVASVGLLAVLVLVVGLYAVRVRRGGGVRFARVEAEGSSALLGAPVMNMAYWAVAPLGRTLSRAGIRPNSITLSSLGLGALSGACVALGHFGIGAALSAASALGDALDGFVARESGTASDAGETLDAAVDRYTEFFFLGGLALFYHDQPLLLALVLAALLGSFMVSYATAKAEALRVTPPRGAMRRAERATYLTVAAALVPFGGGGVFSWPWSPTLPVLAALGVVAMVANFSAVERLARTAELVRDRTIDGSAAAGASGVGRSPSESATAEVALLAERGRDAGTMRSVVR